MWNEKAILSFLALVVILVVLRHLSLRPALSTATAFAALVLASIRFRERDATESLASAADLQVVFELGLFALAAWVSFAIAMGPGRFQALLRMSKLEKSIAAFIALALVSVLWSEAPTLSLVRALQLATLAFVVLVSIRTTGVNATLNTMGSAILGYVLTASALAVLFEGARGGMVTFTEVKRFSWFSTHPIDAADSAGLAFLFAGFNAIQAWHRRSTLVMVAFGASLPLLFVILLSTRSRGALAALVLTLAIVAVRALRRPGVVLMAALSSLCVGLILAILLTSGLVGANGRSFLDDTALASWLSRGQESDQILEMSGRLPLWSEALNLSLERPLLGFGYMGARERMLELRPWASHAHNGPIQTFLDLGAIGLLLWWLPILVVLFGSYRGWDTASPERRLIGALLMFLTLGSGYNPVLAGRPDFHLIVAFVCLYGYNACSTALTNGSP